MNTSRGKNLLIFGFGAGIVLALIKTFIANSMMGVHPGVTLVVQLGVATALGYGVAHLLKEKISSAKVVAIFALLFTYAGSNLVLFTQIAQYLIYLVLVGILAAGMFYTSNWFFNSSKVEQKNKLTVALAAFVVWLILCAIVGPIITRLVWSN